MTIFHPLNSDLPMPERFTYPFCYEPHPLALAACSALQSHIQNQPRWKDELERGKMFGVLVCTDPQGQLGFLAAYSGLLDGSNCLDYFVPAVYDLLQPDGHFKQGEEKLNQLTRHISDLAHSPELTALADEKQRRAEHWQARIGAFKEEMEHAKRRRDLRRHQPDLTPADEQEMIGESQFQKAELKRLKAAAKLDLAKVEEQLANREAEINSLKAQRKQMSDTLQRWIFDQYRLLNARGEVRTVNDIFYGSMHATPPSGTGECCAPKLLQWAYSHGLKPMCMAEFWWGKSPKTEVRHHLHFYPACRSKCKPLLEHMLQGLDVDENPLAADPHCLEPEVVYEDRWLAVVDKPGGMLAVPGKDSRRSVLSWAKERWPEAEGPIVVHRLDMDTSGLMVLAKDKTTHKALQAEFIDRDVKKRYMAVLDGRLSPDVKRDGTVILPLRPDLDDRPRQLVDAIHGKRAITSYRVISETDHETLIALYPHTGRTHQLRVHCAHADGLRCPIKGDNLYGHPSDRLYLHAEEITFRHPSTGKMLTVCAPCSWRKERSEK